jgi:hypothetical protein
MPQPPHKGILDLGINRVSRSLLFYIKILDRLMFIPDI